MKAATKEQIAEWKAVHGNIYQLEAENGKACIIKDPLADLNVMKMAAEEMKKGLPFYLECIINQCWLHGDEEMKKDEAIITGLEDQLDAITQVPSCEVLETETGFELTCNGKVIQVKKAMREDVLKAQRKNASNKPYMTNIYLLRLIASPEDAELIEKDSVTLFGVLSALDQIKNKTSVAVKKL